METIYYPEDDILKLVFSEKPIVKETTQDWNVNLSFAQDGEIVEIVIIDAVASGMMPFHSKYQRAA